jgi:hypothetical protein
VPRKSVWHELSVAHRHNAPDRLGRPLLALGFVREGGEVTLGLAVPPHAGDGAPPTALHRRQRRLVVGGAARDSVPEMAVLRPDDLVGVSAVVCEVTWSAELSARRLSSAERCDSRPRSESCHHDAVTNCPHGMPTPATCFECMEEGNLPSSGPAGRIARELPASLEGEHDGIVYAAIVEAGVAGVTLAELEERTGLRSRVLQNVTWRLEVKQNRVHHVPSTRPRRYAPGGAGSR